MKDKLNCKEFIGYYYKDITGEHFDGAHLFFEIISDSGIDGSNITVKDLQSLYDGLPITNSEDVWFCLSELLAGFSAQRLDSKSFSKALVAAALATSLLRITGRNEIELLDKFILLLSMHMDKCDSSCRYHAFQMLFESSNPDARN